jgi:hypothetical protein
MAISLDALTEYYDKRLKLSRHALLSRPEHSIVRRTAGRQHRARHCLENG